MESQDDSVTPRGLIENILEHNNVEHTIALPRKRRFFRTPKEQRTIAGSTYKSKRRHVSASDAQPAPKKSKSSTDVANATATPITLIERMVGGDQSTEQTVRVSSRVTRQASGSSNTPHNRSRRRSLREKVAMKQLVRANIEEATPRGLIEGFIEQEEQSETLLVNPHSSANKTNISDIDLQKKKRKSSLGESFFISSSAPEPRHLQSRKTNKRAVIDKEQFADQLGKKIENLREAEIEPDNISFTTNIQKDLTEHTAQTTNQEQTQELKRVLTSRSHVSAVTPGTMPSLPSFSINQSEAATEDVVEEESLQEKAPSHSAHASTSASFRSPSTSWQSDSSLPTRSSRRLSTSNRSVIQKQSQKISLEKISSASRSKLITDIIDNEEVIEERDRESLGTGQSFVVRSSQRQNSLQGNQIVEDGFGTENMASTENGTNGENETSGETEASGENEAESENESSDDAESGDESDNTPENEENVDSELEKVDEREADIIGENDKSKRISRRKQVLNNDEQDKETASSRMLEMISTRNESTSIADSVRAAEDSTMATNMTATNETTTLRGYDTLRTPKIHTPSSRSKATIKSSKPGTSEIVQNSTPGTSQQSQGQGAKSGAAAKTRSRRSGQQKSTAATQRLPRTLTKSIFAHFTTLGFSRDTLDAVEKVSDKFWSNLVKDVGAFTAHAHRVTVEHADIELLMNRQGFITEKQSLHGLIEKWLPLEYRQELIPIARPGNKVFPKPKKS